MIAIQGQESAIQMLYSTAYMLSSLMSCATGLKADQHDHNAAAHWQNYYDQETADLVFLLYSDDFRAFGYDRFVVPQT